MKTITWSKKLLAILLALCMLLALAACGSSTTSEDTSGDTSTEETTESEAPEVEEPSADAISSGTYTFTYLDEYGDATEFTVTTKDTGKVYVMYDGALGSETLNGDGWTDNGDGTMTTAALSGEIAVDWVNADGTITWTVDGETVTPVGYTEPTEFLDKPYTDPTTGAEAVGVYTFGFVNDYGATTPYVLWLNADGTFNIFMESSWVGTMEYYGDSWTINEASVVALGPCSYEDEAPKTDGNGAYWFADDTYESSWVLSGDGTCVPVGYDGTIGEIDLSTLSEESYPAGAEDVGVYTFGFVNGYGATSPYAVKLKDDGTAIIVMDSSWVGAQSYTGTWTKNDDGTVTIGDMSYEGEAPKTDSNDATWFADDTYESTWEFDGTTCTPVNYDGSSEIIDASALSEDAIAVLDAF